MSESKRLRSTRETVAEFLARGGKITRGSTRTVVGARTFSKFSRVRGHATSKSLSVKAESKMDRALAASVKSNSKS